MEKAEWMGWLEGVRSLHQREARNSFVGWISLM